MVHVYGSCIRSCGVVCVWLMCMAHVYGSFVLLTGVVSWDALSLQVIFRKRALYLVALLRKMTCNLRHPMSLRHPVLNGVSRVFSHPGVVLCGFSHTGGVFCVFSHLCECGSFANALCVHWCVLRCHQVSCVLFLVSYGSCVGSCVLLRGVLCVFSHLLVYLCVFSRQTHLCVWGSVVKALSVH